MTHQEQKNISAERLIHSEHGESDHMVRAVQKGGIVGGGIALTLIAAIFSYIHITGAVGLLTWYQYVLWVISSMTLVFVAAIVGMLTGVLYSLAQAKIQQALHHKEALADALIEISMRKKIRKLLSL